MERIDLRELAGYERDDQGLSDFQRPFRLPSLLGLIIMLGGFFLIIVEAETNPHHRGAQVTFYDHVWLQFVEITRMVGPLAPFCQYLPVALFLGGLLFLFITITCLARATPISRTSGQKLEKYWNAHPDPGCREIVYVDHAARTFFTRIIDSYRWSSEP